MELRRVFFGEGRATRLRYGAEAIVLGLVATFVPINANVGGLFNISGGNLPAAFWIVLFVAVLGVITLVRTAFAGYRGAGFVICLVVPTCVVLGVNSAYWIRADTLRWSLWQWSGPPLGILLGVPIGAAGYLVGRSIARST